MLKRILYIVILFVSLDALCQTQTFKDGKKWGIKENEKTLIAPFYDTIFNFDAAGKVCLACHKAKPVNNNRFIKLTGPTYNCNYLNKKGERLIITNAIGDTASVFALGKNAVKQYQEDPKYIIAGIKDKKYLTDKNFKQITAKDYTEIYFTDHPEFIMAEIKTEGNMILKGLLDLNEKEIIPFLYSNIKILPDSIIVACSAGVGVNREDDIYNYAGKKLDSYRRHIDLVTKDYVIHKIFEPKEYYIIYNTKTKEEKMVYAEQAQLYEGEELLMANDDHWFTYNMATGKKKSYDHKHKKENK
ncbi:MAG: hypothetical protein K0S32_3336 [Bacteroidetes bacterium]|nr:hypothetical protein [Bacteroidota bacterium]